MKYYILFLIAVTVWLSEAFALTPFKEATNCTFRIHIGCFPSNWKKTTLNDIANEFKTHLQKNGFSVSIENNNCEKLNQTPNVGSILELTNLSNYPCIRIYTKINEKMTPLKLDLQYKELNSLIPGGVLISENKYFLCVREKTYGIIDVALRGEDEKIGNPLIICSK